MSIKKRLLVSNILMLIIPTLLSVIAGGIMFLAFTGVINLNDSSSYYDSERFWGVVDNTDQMFVAWSKNPDLQGIKADIDQFNLKNQNGSISLSLFENNQLVYPNSPVATPQGVQFSQIIADGQATHTGVLDNYAFYSRRIGGYTAVLICSQYLDVGSNYLKYKNTMIDFAAVLFASVITIICVTNYLLTKSLLKRIADPLEILNYGVHQIQLGNLDYRIEYSGNDEFSTICSDFNLMAQKLRESVELRKKDELSRKELIAGISHDLRTPLTSIKAYVEGLLDGIATTPQIQKSYLKTIKAKAENIDQIVDKLSLFSKLDIGEFPFYPEKLSIGEELSTFIEENSKEYRSKGLLLTLTQNLPNTAINIDPVQFYNVITNILENSVKYKEKELGIMEIACFEQREDVWITFSDDGPGVPAESLEKLFDIFFRNDPSRNNTSKGSGLGLAITAKIIERSDGHIWAENVPDGGLRIVITLPKFE